MYFEEHIERLKREFPSSDFRVPFTEATEVLKKIEKIFIKVKDIHTDLNNTAQYCSNWTENLKNKTELKSINIFQIKEYLEGLDPNKKYWTILASKSNPSTKHYLYDTKVNSMIALLNLKLDDFFIADKKYEWLIYFHIDREQQNTTIYKSGNNKTPFE
ncbi:MAG: DUF6756 family protein [Microscillaceae bacterium]|nr:DUF6756 family protein [Microscillaceae bacterium]